MWAIYRRYLGFLVFLVWAANSAGMPVGLPSTALSPAEQQQVTQRIRAFYANPDDPAPMTQPIPKFDAVTGQPVDPNPELKLASVPQGGPLAQLAQAKASPEFTQDYCRFLAQYFPGVSCGMPGSWSSIETNDTVEALAYTWLPSVSHDLDQIPTSGQSAMGLWSDDYWKTLYGQTSYRYATKTGYSTYQEAIKSYEQPRQWQGLLADLDPSQLAAQVLNWSPSEKYDLSVGDEQFSLTNQQKQVGAASVGSDGNVEAWMGLCHGWSAASLMVPKPIQPAHVVGPRGLDVQWYPADVRAMATLAWGNGSADSNFVGGRCNAVNPATYPNGRLKDQNCFDSNPATVHLAFGNMIGRGKLSFIMDATYDYQVWNQPLYSYEMTYFNPLSPDKTSKKWSDVAVNYDAAFKAKDRFQSPLTRGVRHGSGNGSDDKWDDTGIQKIVGVTMTVVYLIEQQPPDHTPTPEAEQYTRATYTYDLELHSEGGQLVAEGGEWHELAHPDFLWIPRKTTSVRSSFDYLDIGYTGTPAPAAIVTDTAQQASAKGFPLCQVLKQLVKQSSGVDGYICPAALP